MTQHNFSYPYVRDASKHIVCRACGVSSVSSSACAPRPGPVEPPIGRLRRYREIDTQVLMEIPFVPGSTVNRLLSDGGWTWSTTLCGWTANTAHLDPPPVPFVLER